MSEHEKHIEELISKQVQSAVSPLSAMTMELRTELRGIKEELKAIREENKVFKDLITGARFLGLTGKVVLSIGAIVGMFWAMFLAIKSN